ncbi:ERMAP protein, partial [Upupa epops]|nr:ERMAP protein [Upupa epops]
VTLDPDTAHCLLVLSPDRRSVSFGNIQLNLPETPQRFEKQSSVLGSQRFMEGRHCWEVEVKMKMSGLSRWAVGVAKESVKRKEFVGLDPQNGVWALRSYQGKLEALTVSHNNFSCSFIPRRIWVCLNYPHGWVTFMDGDTGAEIFTF